MAALIKDVFSVQAAKKHVQIRLHCPVLPLMVGLGVDAMEQVISNLVINALDAVPAETGEILIRIVPAEGKLVVLEVADNGPGIATDLVDHIFDPFFTTKEVGAGTGLGLTVIYGIVSDVGGRVEIGRSSELGGACFTVYLPAAAPVEAAIETGGTEKT